MLFPQTNRTRSVQDLSGLWKFKTDPENVGEQEKWYAHLDTTIEVAVPGSWNEQLEELGLLNYVGTAWYAASWFVPAEYSGRRIWLRVGSADYRSKVWVNGQYLGEHRHGFLPFEFDITRHVVPGEPASVVVSVSNLLTPDSIPQGVRADDYIREDRLREGTFPPARFDYFPFGGIQRPVLVYTIPSRNIEDVKVETRLSDKRHGRVQIRMRTQNAEGLSATCTLLGGNDIRSFQTKVQGTGLDMGIDVPECRPWSPNDPFLYTLCVELRQGSDIVDTYTLSIGIREVTLRDGRLLLNGDPVYLKGFGRHEDFPVIGKGLLLPLMVKDFNLMKWVNANSFRTSHYPYAEEVMAMADRQGFLVIDEVPANSLDMRHVTGQTLANHKEYTERLIDRDYNHPSVIMWALGNEPNIVGEKSYYDGSGRAYWKEVFAHAKALDAVRPMIVPNCLRAGIDDPVFEFSDIVAINRYYGWYEYPGQLDVAIRELEREMELLHEKYGKPLMLTEFGADTIPGLHSTSDQIFTEEYQGRMLERYVALLRSKSYTVGEHVWNFADFRTSQHFRRVVWNMKGVFTRTREPKRAAFTLRSLWKAVE